MIKQWIKGTIGVDEDFEQSDLNEIEDQEIILSFDEGNNEVAINKEVAFLKKEIVDDDLDALADEEARNRLFAEKVRARLEALRQLLKQGPQDKAIEDKLNKITETVNEVFQEPKLFLLDVDGHQESKQISPFVNTPGIKEDRPVEHMTRQEIIDYITGSLSKKERIVIKWSIRNSVAKAERYKGDSNPDTKTLDAIRFFNALGGNWCTRELEIQDMKKSDIRKLVLGFDNKNTKLSVYPVGESDASEFFQRYDENEI